MVQLRDPERYERLVEAAEAAIEQRKLLYAQLSGVRLDLPFDPLHGKDTRPN